MVVLQWPERPLEKRSEYDGLISPTDLCRPNRVIQDCRRNRLLPPKAAMRLVGLSSGPVYDRFGWTADGQLFEKNKWSSSFSRFLIVKLGLKKGIRLAGTFTLPSVRWFLPVRLSRIPVVKVPRPRISRRLPRPNASQSPQKVLTTRSTSAAGSSGLSATRDATDSDLTITLSSGPL
jgi:hypothetical protein